MSTARKIVLIAIWIFLFSALTKNIFDYRNTVAFYESFKKDYEELAHQNQELKTRLLKSRDNFEVEKTIRNKLNMVKDGEIAVMIDVPTPTPSPTPAPDSPPYAQWYALFFGN